MLACKQINTRQCCISCTVDVYRIRLKAHLLTISCERFHLIKKYNTGPLDCGFRNDLMKESCHLSLALAERGTCKCVWVYLHEPDFCPFKSCGDLVCEPLSKRCFSCTWQPREHN